MFKKEKIIPIKPSAEEVKGAKAGEAMNNEIQNQNDSKQTRLLKKDDGSDASTPKEIKINNHDSTRAAKKSTRKKRTKKQAQEETVAKSGLKKPEAADKEKEEPEMMVPTTTLKKVESQRDEYLELSQRMRADLENYRKRVTRRQDDDRVEAQASILGKMLDPLDDLKRALAAAEGDNNFEALFAGLKMVHDGFDKAFASIGFEAIAAAPGTMFNPNVHEAVIQIPHPELAAGMIVEEIAPGYKLGDRILRAPKVVVSSGQPEDGEN